MKSCQSWRGELSRRKPTPNVHINGVTMSPGIGFGGGVQFGSVELSQYIGRDLEAEQMPDGVWDITGVYNL